MINVSIDTHTVEEVKQELINKLKSKINHTLKQFAAKNTASNQLKIMNVRTAI